MEPLHTKDNNHNNPGQPKQPAVENEGFFDGLIKQWWGKIALGVLFGGLTYWIYNDLTRLENGEVESIMMNRRLAAVYETFGKWPLVGGMGLGALSMLVWGARQFSKGKQSE